MLKKTLLGATAAILAATSAFAMDAKKDIVDTAVEAGSFETLVAAVQAAGLVDTLKGDGPFTVFAPSEAEIDLARRQIQAFDEALAEGSGLAVLDGSIVENLHVEPARMTLAQAEIIAQRAEG